MHRSYNEASQVRSYFQHENGTLPYPAGPSFDEEWPDYNADYTNVVDTSSFGWCISRDIADRTPFHSGCLTLRMLSHAALLSYREGRALAGVDTYEIDEEITRRVLLQPQMWPDFYDQMQTAGVLDQVYMWRQAGAERLEDELIEPEARMAYAHCNVQSA